MKTVQPLDDDGIPKLPEYSDSELEELIAKTQELMAGHGQKPEKPIDAAEKSPAADLIRAKINSVYEKEPDAKEELAEAEAAGNHRSRHQSYMHELNSSGKSLAEIQVAWHAYYSELSDKEKHEVWQEFYEQHSRASAHAKELAKTTTKHQPNLTPTVTTLGTASPKSRRSLTRPAPTPRSVSEIKQQIVEKVDNRKRLSAKQHIKSLVFGLGMSAIFIVLISFSFFNERFIAPFMSPSRNVSATPIVGSSGVVGAEPKILIPKINLEVPVVYDLGTNEEAAVQRGLEEGVVHYDGTPNPGEQGNVSIVGHSSNNILNKGKYKFAFVLLNRMETGDLIYLHKDGVRYTYQVFENRIVPPSDVSVLGPSSKPNTVTLITCDPPGTSINRRVVVAEQISPDPKANKESSATLNADPQVLPSNAPSLWSRIFGS